MTPAAISSTTNNNNQQQGYALVNGLQLYYEIHGDGRPLLLLHGGGSTINSNFTYLLPILSAHYKVIAVELQAHGRTPDRGTATSFEQDADDAAGLLSYLGIKTAAVLGFSNGGSTALQLAIRHTAMVEQLVLISAMYKRSGLLPGFFEGMQHASLENMPAPLQEAFLLLKNDEQALQVMHDRDKNRMLAFQDWPDEYLQRITAPTLLISGDKDVILPAHTLAMAALIPHSHVMILPGGHGAAINEICAAIPGSSLPAFTASAIIEFLNNPTNAFS